MFILHRLYSPPFLRKDKINNVARTSSLGTENILPSENIFVIVLNIFGYTEKKNSVAAGDVGLLVLNTCCYLHRLNMSNIQTVYFE